MTHGLDGPAPEKRRLPNGRRNEQGIRVDPEVEVTHEPRRTVISALVQHEPGVLAEVSGLFSRRQFNIESLTVGPTKNEDRARITLVVEEPDPGIDQVKKQLRKLVPVVSVRELEPDAMSRELALIKVDAHDPAAVNAVGDMYDAKTVDSSPETATFEVTGARQKIEAAIETFGQFGIREIDRTGTTALARGTDETAGPTPAEERVSTADEANQQYTTADDD
ncbi:acetolactate synthase small subunit [Natronobacterium gregoryi]|uniref:Acetolactate synthase small subunit n=2 Tax=Natronobacterium gregoryi TaxID=44930 RepID=L0ABT0_NATGS|nr:acetolactate synthase small subunit [Natronobacterium gregoryi]AFZ71348.1 acetolactate synthase, small subunit [Natronobacterium gregoryi SP2]ELY67050.1 acetolactate synthase small subunit [Natronobacterium gregoryi SP2]PLK21272.1 acetolactate synthase small subunit [Natronobacterium gregoryi SP2]SFI85807.1 acetolactate synthase, small subunit [Natronobacterium gregoryi]